MKKSQDVNILSTGICAFMQSFLLQKMDVLMMSMLMINGNIHSVSNNPRSIAQSFTCPVFAGPKVENNVNKALKSIKKICH